MTRRADPRQQAFWPQPSCPPSDAPRNCESDRPPPPLPLQQSPPDVTSTAATPTNAAPSDAADALIDVERTAQVVGHLLPLLRELKRRADAAATHEHNGRILNGPLRTSKQDATNEQSEEFNKPDRADRAVRSSRPMDRPANRCRFTIPCSNGTS